MSVFILTAVSAAIASAGGLWLGRQLGWKAGSAKGRKDLEAQYAELLRQQVAMREIEKEKQEVQQQIAASETKEEVGDVLADVSTDWNSGN